MKEFRVSKKVEGGTIKDDESHKPLNLLETKELMSYLKCYDLALFNGVLMSLSTCSRVEEAVRLIKWVQMPLIDRDAERAMIVVEGAYLNYKAGYIVQKTEAKIDPEKLNNPRMSIVTRIILNGTEPCRWFTPAEVSKKGNGSIRVLEPRLKEFYPRRVRCTGATNLAFCEKTDTPFFAKLTMSDVQDACGHNVRATTERYYARTQPTQLNSAEEYLGIDLPDLFTEKDGLMEGSNVWDAFLLKLFVEANLAACPNEIVAARKRKLYEEIAKQYKRDARVGLKTSRSA